MNRPLTGRTALVTGGTRGLGAAIVRTLAARGATVAFSYVRSAVAAESLSREIRAGGGTAEGFQADQADPTAAAGLPGRVLDRFGALDTRPGWPTTPRPRPPSTAAPGAWPVTWAHAG